MCLLPHATSWTSCCFHSLGTHAALMHNPSDFVFPLFQLPATGLKQINDELRRITKQYETATDLNKPANLFKGNISTHSVRAGATQRMHLNKALKPEWEDIRCGREKKAKSKTAYISREWECDYPCALVLANWDRIDSGGMCPTISAIPKIQHAEFQHFIVRLFSAVPTLSLSLCEMLGCILLLWHFEVEKDFPSHPVVLKIKSLLPADKLTEWCTFIKSDFKQKNEATLPLHIVQDMSIAEIFTSHGALLNRIDERLIGAVAFQGTQERFNSAVAQQLNGHDEILTRNNELLVRNNELLQQLLDGNGVNIRKKRRGNTVLHQQTHMDDFSIQPTNAASNGEAVLDQEVAIIAANDVVAEQEAVLKEQPRLRKYTTNLQTLFFSWYQVGSEYSILFDYNQIINFANIFLGKPMAVSAK